MKGYYGVDVSTITTTMVNAGIPLQLSGNVVVTLAKEHLTNSYAIPCTSTIPDCKQRVSIDHVTDVFDNVFGGPGMYDWLVRTRPFLIRVHYRKPSHLILESVHEENNRLVSVG